MIYENNDFKFFKEFKVNVDSKKFLSNIKKYIL